MKIAIGCDHAATTLKAVVIEHLKARGIEPVDVGTHSTASCHYPVYAHAVCEKIQSGECTLGILICGTGIGMSIAANKHRGQLLLIQAVLVQLALLHQTAASARLAARTPSPQDLQESTTTQMFSALARELSARAWLLTLSMRSLTQNTQTAATTSRELQCSLR